MSELDIIEQRIKRRLEQGFLDRQMSACATYEIMEILSKYTIEQKPYLERKTVNA